jgi:hypothetical protein
VLLAMKQLGTSHGGGQQVPMRANAQPVPSQLGSGVGRLWSALGSCAAAGLQVLPCGPSRSRGGCYAPQQLCWLLPPLTGRQGGHHRDFRVGRALQQLQLGRWVLSGSSCAAVQPPPSQQPRCESRQRAGSCRQLLAPPGGTCQGATASPCRCRQHPGGSLR